MKRIISVVLVALLLALSAFVLVACGGGMSDEDDWNNMVEAYKTADALTLKIEDNKKSALTLERLNSTLKISFDAEKGVLYINLEYARRNAIGVKRGGSTYEYYYIIDGTSVIYHNRRIGDYSQEWENPYVFNFTTRDEAEDFLRDKYLHVADPDDEEIPNFLELGYLGRGLSTGSTNTTENLFKTKYTIEFSDETFQYTYTLHLSNGKISKFVYQHKAASGIDDTRKTTVTIKYTASITVPDDLPAVDSAE